jgi:5-methyltetrahydrofolate--homocysteine methyltransferase
MRMATFLEALHSGRVLLMDGAMGSELLRLGLPAGACREAADLNYQLRARAILDAYVAAGAECVLTNTFQINPVTLAPYGLAAQTKAICGRASQMAIAATATNAHARYVVGDIGPFEPPEEAFVRPMVDGLSADAYLLETCSDTRMIAPTLKVVGSDNPLLVSFTFLRNRAGDLTTIAGRAPEEMASEAARHSIAALGVNCGRDISMDDCIEISRRYRSVTDLPLFARPNAGTPLKVDGQWVYPHTPEKMAGKLPELLEAGVAMVGGCCGTTPAHIAAFRPIVEHWNVTKAAGGLARER